MTDYPARRSKTRPPTHPGAVLREVLDATGLTRAETARRLGISRQHLLDVLAERKPVSAAVAVKFGKLFGQSGGLWIRMQTAYDLWRAEREVDVSKIKTLEPA
jgi:addiction module HigA family antidote